MRKAQKFAKQKGTNMPRISNEELRKIIIEGTKAGGTDVTNLKELLKIQRSEFPKGLR